MTLQWVVQWFNILFLLPLALSLVYLGVYAMSGWTFGDADIDHDADVDHDLEVDAEGDVEADQEVDSDHDSDFDPQSSSGSSEGILSWLGVGRVPLSLVLVLMMMSFGVIGFITNQVARDFVQDAAIIFISLPVAVTGCAVVTRSVSRLLHRFMPMNETFVEHKQDLLGLTGEAIFTVDEQFGLVAVRDRRGNLQQVPCRVDRGRLAIEKGSAVTLVGYSPQSHVYTVIPDTPAAMSRTFSERE